MNFGTWKIKVNEKDQLEFHHKKLKVNIKKMSKINIKTKKLKN